MTAAATDPVIARYLDAQWMEKGLSENSLAAYRRDLEACDRCSLVDLVSIVR